jgi:hypothetical protein
MQKVLLLELSSLEVLRHRKISASFTLPSDWIIPIAAKQKFSFLKEVYFASFPVAKSTGSAFHICSELYYCFSVSCTISNSINRGGYMLLNGGRSKSTNSSFESMYKMLSLLLLLLL